MISNYLTQFVVIYTYLLQYDTSSTVEGICLVLLDRLTSGAQVYPQGNGAAASDWPPGAICNYYLRYYWP